MRALRVSQEGARVLEYDPVQPDKLRERGCVHVVPNEAIDDLVAAGAPIRSHGRKHPDKGLATYLLPRGETHDSRIQAIKTQYSHVRRLMEQGIKGLLAAASDQDWSVAMLLGVPRGLFEELLAERGAVAGRDVKKDSRGAAAKGIAGLLDELQEAHVPEDTGSRFLGTSVEARLARCFISIAATHEDVVLIQGETGTGKEIVARRIHELTQERKRREGKPEGVFVAVNCGAVPDTLFESDFFGYVPGAFTGALRKGKTGSWEQANNGTLFLDEVAELPPNCQVKILRALQEGRIRPVGASKDREVNARVIAASCSDLGVLVAEGRFREDLYHRLCQFIIRTPPLDADSDQIPDVIRQLWRQVAGEGAPSLSGVVMERLAGRRWTGNFRGLKNFLGRLRHLPGKRVTPERLDQLMAYYGMLPEPAAMPDVLAAARQIDGVRHRLRAAETLRALRAALKPLVAKGRHPIADIQLSLSLHLVEMEFLVRQPLAFPSEKVYAAVAAVAAKVLYLKSLLSSDPRRACAFCAGDVIPAVDGALRAMGR